jgi:HTH-type transcriptional regulator / antitoxin HigA
MEETMSAAESDILDEVQLPLPKTLADYRRLVVLLNALIDQVGEDESHPLARFMDHVGNLVEEFERHHIPEL